MRSQLLADRRSKKPVRHRGDAGLWRAVRIHRVSELNPGASGLSQALAALRAPQFYVMLTLAWSFDELLRTR
jgi:hypothetical protein